MEFKLRGMVVTSGDDHTFKLMGGDDCVVVASDPVILVKLSDKEVLHNMPKGAYVICGPASSGVFYECMTAYLRD